MKFELEISDKELKEAVLSIMAEAYYRDCSHDRNTVNRIVAECVREIIYKDKERIVEKIVERASRECSKKAIKKILDGLEEK